MLKKLRILLADDEAILRLDLREMLAEAGHDVVGEAANGEEAVKMARQLQPEFIIMDVKMPVMDGMSALQIIHARWPKTQIILLSGHADMQLAVQAMSEGAFGYLMKPVDIDELLFKIEDAVTQVRLEAGQG